MHNDAGCAVANSLVAVDAGVLQVQGTVNGYGERTGNADIVPITADLVLKMGVTDALPDGSVAHLTELAHYVAEIANLSPEPRQPYAGRHAFTHKAGLHTSGVARVSRAYEHVEPDAVGNRRSVVASDYSGGASIRMKADEFGLALGDAAIPAAVRATEGARVPWVHLRPRRGLAGTVAPPRRRVGAAVLHDRELPRPRRGAIGGRRHWPRPR